MTRDLIRITSLALVTILLMLCCGCAAKVEEKEIPEINGKDIALLYPKVYNRVRNDATGRWKYIVIKQDGISIPEFAISCYYRYFENDSTVLFVINEGDQTITRMLYAFGYVSVTVFRYTDGEELDAKKIGSGQLISEYYVNIETGVIEKTI